MAKPRLKFKKSPKFPHQRSEGTTRRGEARQVVLMQGKPGKRIVVTRTNPLRAHYEDLKPNAEFMQVKDWLARTVQRKP